MALYDYKCELGHWTVRSFPIATAPSVAPCGWMDSNEYATTGCDRIAARSISAPSVHITGGTNAGYVKR